MVTGVQTCALPIWPDLEYIDLNTGSVPLKLVVRDEQGRLFNNGEAMERLWQAHQVLEKAPNVGTVVSLPLLLMEAKSKPLGFLLPAGWIIKLMEGPAFGKVARYVVDESKERALFVLMMREEHRSLSREEVIMQIRQILHHAGLNVDLTGGAYFLMSKLSHQVLTSLYYGLILLILVFVGMTGFFVFSLSIGLSVGICLMMIPLALLGLQGFFALPLDIISAPGPSLAVSMGVDAMIHLLARVKRAEKYDALSAENWAEALSVIWRPVTCTVFILSAGFAVFTFSQFPPTRRFGLTIMIGITIASLATIFVLPWIVRLIAATGKRREVV
jgi:hypothetical protein